MYFQDPLPAKPWSGVRDAIKEGDYAAQFDLFSGVSSGSEDCLFANVHTPQLPTGQNDLLPVMVNIHGGGFVNGNGNNDSCGPEYLVEEGVILVNFNYRLSIFGFLCTDAVNAHGDMGLKDQNLLLKWVQQNIKQFNGDPNNVTLFGISAGSASVEYQMLSPYSKGLFHKVILQSGSTLNTWARTRNGVAKAQALAETMGYKPDSNETVFEYLNKVNTEDLTKASMTVINDASTREGEIFAFTPVINELEDYDGFIKGEPLELLKNGSFLKLPAMSGTCEKEGMMMPGLFYKDAIKAALDDGKYIECIPKYLNREMKDLDSKLRSIYSVDGNINDETIIDFLGDLTMNAGTWISLEQRLKYNTNNEYLYVFTYDGNMNFVKKLLQKDFSGACHGDDTTYLFTHLAINTDDALPSDLAVKCRMTKMWTNFAKSGFVFAFLEKYFFDYNYCIETSKRILLFCLFFSEIQLQSCQA